MIYLDFIHVGAQILSTSMGLHFGSDIFRVDLVLVLKQWLSHARRVEVLRIPVWLIVLRFD